MNQRTHPKTLRCAIYTRVSTDSGLEQDFNSLDNQREAAEAYIKSQAHEGWKLLRDRYDDGGFSGGSLDRPAVQKLLEAIRTQSIDIVVVYKVDRLTRSLADFAKLVDLFDAHEVSFISVTQAFNTTTSMGRLTLNMLLSFAQFEREITGERIRDKVAASKSKGIWMGGTVPLGYRVEDRALHVVEEHAALVRNIFRRYLELGSVVRLQAALNRENIRLPDRTSIAGKTSGGGRFWRGQLYWTLSNPLYIGKLRHKDRVYDGQHAAIIDGETWAKVQERLAGQTQARRVARRDDVSFLSGKLFDDRGNRMGQTHATKNGKRWRYYVSRAVLVGMEQKAGSLRRISAAAIERQVLDAIKSAMVDGHQSDCASDSEYSPGLPLRMIATSKNVDDTETHSSQPLNDLDLLGTIERVTISKHEITIRLMDSASSEGQSNAIVVPWVAPTHHRKREILQGEGSSTFAIRPMRGRTRIAIVESFRRAHRWLDDLTRDANQTTATIAAREGKSERSVRMTISLAFVDPALTQAAIEGRLPDGIGVKRLIDLPMLWSEQWTALGLKTPEHR